MKTKLWMKLILSVLLLFPLGVLIAQVVDPPTDVTDLVVNFNTFIGSLAGYAAACIFLSGLVNGWLKITKSWLKQVVSWLVALVVVLVMTLIFKAGFLVGESAWKVILYALGVGLVSNGIFDIGFVNTAMNWIVVAVGGLIKKRE